MKTSLQISAMTSLPSTLKAKKSMKMTFSLDKIYYNFSQQNPKITNLYIDVIPIDVIPIDVVRTFTSR